MEIADVAKTYFDARKIFSAGSVSVGVEGGIELDELVRQRGNALQEARTAHQLCKMHLAKLRSISPWAFLNLSISDTCLNLGNLPAYESLNNYAILNA